jgi:hypothetical protein
MRPGIALSTTGATGAMATITVMVATARTTKIMITSSDVGWQPQQQRLKRGSDGGGSRSDDSGGRQQSTKSSSRCRKMADVAAAGAEVALAATAAAGAVAEAVAVAVAETAMMAAIVMAMVEGKTRGRGDRREVLGVCRTSLGWGSTYTTWQLFGAN